MSSIKRDFFTALYKSVNPNEKKLVGINDGIKEYYKKQYGKAFAKEFEDRGISSLELAENEKNNSTAPICSLASSGRLAFLHYMDSGYEFEKSLSNDLPKPSHTKIDVYEERDHSVVYYECKCQEILEKSHGLLRDTYLESKLFIELLGGKKPEYTTCIRKSNGKEYNYMIFNLKELGVNIDATYHKIHFDVKQLICHLIAIAVANDNKIEEMEKNNPAVEPKWEAELQYVFFKPNENYLSDSVKNLYKDLEEEIECIKNSYNIKKFCKKHHIKIIAPDYHSVIKECDDKMYQRAFPNG